MSDVTSDKQRTDIEESWVSGEYEKNLRGLKTQIEKDLWGHDQMQARFRRNNIAWQVLLASLSAVFGVVVAITKEYLPGRSDLVSEATLIVVIPALITMYGFFDPAGRRAAHLLVSGQKADTLGKINLQLLQKPKYREKADTFYNWIHSEYSRISGTAMTYLPAGLLAKYPDKEKED